MLHTRLCSQVHGFPDKFGVAQDIEDAFRALESRAAGVCVRESVCVRVRVCERVRVCVFVSSVAGTHGIVWTCVYWCVFIFCPVLRVCARVRVSSTACALQPAQLSKSLTTASTACVAVCVAVCVPVRVAVGVAFAIIDIAHTTT